MKSKLGLTILAMVILLAPHGLHAQQPTSRVILFKNVQTTVAPSTPGQALTIQLWDAATAGAVLYCENQTLDVDVNGTISFNLGAGSAVTPPCPSAPPGLNPADFPSGSSRFLDVVNQGTGASVLAARLPLNAAPFALSPGPPGAPGVVQSVTAGDSSVVVAGTAAAPTVAVSNGGITAAKLGVGAVDTGHIANGAVTSAQLAPNSVTAPSIAAGAVTASNITVPLQLAGSVAPELTVGVIDVLNSGGGLGVVGQSLGGTGSGTIGVFGNSPNGEGVVGNSSNGVGVHGSSLFGLAGRFDGNVHVRGSGMVETKIQSVNERAILSLDSTIGGVNRTWTLESGVLGTPGLFGIFDRSGGARLVIDTAGNVGIGASVPGHPLHVRGSGIIETMIQSVNERAVLSLDSTIAGINRTWTLESGVGGTPGLFGIFDRSGGARLVINTAGNVGIGTNTPQARLDVAGAIRIGGADVAERFEVSGVNRGTTKPHEVGIEPGTVVAIDPRNPGKLIVSHRAYDRGVAGIVSGAGGVNPGMLMGQPGTLADGDQAIAVAGRVYCLADASNGPIRPGDLLTTSATRGHAMKVISHAKAQGAVIGKAMTGLNRGKGLVLVLVTLQ